MSKQFHLFVSVIIPVFNDAERLKHCLNLLENQTYPQTLYEVIVVDNASDNGEEVKAVVVQFNQTSVTYEGFPSSYAARNKGITLAKGDIIAFTDADCLPKLDWIEKGVKNLLKTPHCGLVAGEIDVFFQDNSRITPIELYESITAFPQKELIEKYKYAAAANIFTFKDVIKQVGVFDVNFKSGGDVEWGQRVAKFGYQQVYANDVCVAHPARHSFAQLYKRTVRLTGGKCDMYRQKSSSLAEYHKMYAVGLGQSLVPPVNFWLKILFKSNLKNFQEKLQVCFVMFLVRYISAGEMIRLKLGGISTRD